jgi:hypothetical protein
MGRTTSYPTRAGFILDPSSVDRSSGRQIDWANVGNRFRRTPGTAPVVVNVGAAGASASAVSVPCDALVCDGKATGEVCIPNGTVIWFSAGKFIKLNADAVVGATSLTTLAIPTALVDADVATYPGAPGSGDKVLPAGTVVGELLGTGKVSPRVASTNPAVGFLETDAVENDPIAAKSGYGMIVGGVLYENLLPDASGSPKVLASAIKTELNTAGVSKGFRFEQYADNRA